MHEYKRIEKALAFIAAEADSQPDLDRIAAAVNSSPHHLQRVFTHWVGVSPKKFLQFLTLERAKSSLESSASVLDAALDSGLSGPSRLHDLFVTHEAVTPGEYKARGAGLTITYGWADSPFGECLVMTTPRGICGVGFVMANDAGPDEKGGAGREATFADMAARWPQARFVENAGAVKDLARAMFAGGRDEKLKLVLYGTPWQIKVWEALLRIPPAGLVSYEDIARQLGTERASRAVGSAVGDNPISWLIPCHRVIRKTGVISHYHWGRPRKLAMIGWEAAQADARAAA
jgi:AraC family transcriptional regulator of adaptative response/methylated-DNA-[protein]-cysteine methyltransferase